MTQTNTVTRQQVQDMINGKINQGRKMFKRSNTPQCALISVHFEMDMKLYNAECKKAN
jgi:hypothetical protein